MKKVTTIAIAAVLVIILGGALFLATWDIPPPSHLVEKELANDRLPK